jgi:hypothetical protein
MPNRFFNVARANGCTSGCGVLPALYTSTHECIFRHETRVTTTDSVARAKFRRYWAVFSPGIKLIRWLLLPQVRAEAERHAA